MFRVIKEFKPTWIVGENVAGIISMAQQEGEFDVESEVDINEDSNGDDDAGGILCEIIDSLECVGYTVQTFVIPAVAVGAPHRRDRIWIVANRQSADKDTISIGGGRWGEDGRQVLECQSTQIQAERPDSQGGNAGWGRNWIEVATELCGVDDGLPAGLDGFKLSKSRHRAERLKALGNSIVPQVVIEILKAIKTVDISMI